jgi:hypothetical protein
MKDMDKDEVEEFKTQIAELSPAGRKTHRPHMWKWKSRREKGYGNLLQPTSSRDKIEKVQRNPNALPLLPSPFGSFPQSLHRSRPL